jgi:general secretion pathway protein A
MLTSAEFLEMALMDFGISDIPVNKAQRLAKLKQLLVTADRQKRICALIVDEAHKLSPEVLEEIRLLGNFEQSDHKLIQILFLGQNELADVLNRNDLRQLKQRVAARFTIGPLADAEVKQYMQHRWCKAGGSPDIPFTEDSIGSIMQYSQGIPRVINAICDNALLLAFAEGKSPVQANHVWEACASLDLVKPVRPAEATAPAAPAKPLLPGTVPAAAILGSYREPAPPQSFFAKWAGRLGLAQ